MFLIMSTDTSVDFSRRCFFKIMNFWDRFRQSFKPFYSFGKKLFMGFLEFSKKYSRKTALWSLVLLILQRGVFRTQSNNYDGVVNTPLSQVSAFTRTFL